MGIIYKERGDYEKAAEYFRSALVRLTQNYTRPRNCEPFYHLGLILQAQGQLEAAYDTLYRAAWDHAFTAPAYYHLAEISIHRNDYDQALIELDRCLMNNASHLNALTLKASLLRKMGESDEVKHMLEKVIDKDKLNFWAQYELASLLDEDEHFNDLAQLMRYEPESFLELSLNYLNAGFMEEAKHILSWATESDDKRLALYPTIHYYLGYLASLEGDQEMASTHFQHARNQSIDYCFPFRLETINVYHTALEYEPTDAKAHYYLGNLLYDKQAQKAIEHWKEAVSLDSDMAMAHRNLGWGYYQTHNELEKAINSYEQAIASNNQQARFYAELDRLYEQHGTPIEKRYEILANNHEVVAELNHSLIREAMVATAAEEYDHAIDILTNYYFNRQEGNNQIHDIYVDAQLLRGKKYLQEGKWKLALEDFKAADLYPENQSIGQNEKPERQAQIFYLTGLALENMGNKEEARKWYQKSIDVEVQEPSYHFQQAMAYKQLGKESQAEALLATIEEKGNEMLQAEEEVDFFSKFGGNELENKRKASAKYLLGIANLGRGEIEASISHLKETIQLYPGHAWARRMLQELN